MLQQDQPEDFVLATGQTHSVREFAQVAFSHLGLDYKEYIVQDPRYMRPAEVELLVGNPAKAQEKLGWSTLTTFEELVHIMVDAEVRCLTKTEDLSKAGK